uniref:HDC00775 n=1 Tax=Drosophila melanogaster TaxID=7227 RepID=Q6IHV5_DROME|nr:TPA_inf: HDC00775 [Drosophila melanogaster]
MLTTHHLHHLHHHRGSTAVELDKITNLNTFFKEHEAAGKAGKVRTQKELQPIFIK